MAASMHLARIATGMPKGVGFLHGKGVHVGAQPDGTTVVRALALNDAHHARFSQASMYRDAPGLEPFSDEIGGASFFEGQFAIGRAACRARVCKYVSISVVAVS